MKQILCVWFPFWPIQRRFHVQPELKGQVVVLHTALESRSPRVVSCSRKAIRQGVQPGMPLAEARSLVPRGQFLEHAPAEDKETLRQLAWECQQFTPRVGLEETEEPDCLFLDVTGCEHLFGDIRGLCFKVARYFRERSYWVKGACAPTWGAAMGIARYAAPAVPKRNRSRERLFEIISADAWPSRLNSLPVNALRLPAETLSMLGECGLKTIGQLLELPRSSLPSRFGSQLLLRLDQTLGTVDELLTPEVPPQPIIARERWEYPLHDAASIESVLRTLLERVLVELRQRQRATQELRVSWKTETGVSEPLTIRLLKPTHSADKLAELLSLRQERFPLSGGVTSIEMEVIPSLREPAKRNTLFEQDDTRETDFTHLIERLSHRLGEAAVMRYRLHPEAQPELAATSGPWLQTGITSQPTHSASAKERTKQQRIERAVSNNPSTRSGPAIPTRPLRLLSFPERVTGRVTDAYPLESFRWRGHDYRVTDCSWPERIVTGWWRTRSIHRDYYRIDTEGGARFWLFRDLENHQWSVHGVFE